MAIFSLLVLSVVVTSITLLRLKPGGGDTVPPPPSPPPVAMGIGGAVALSGGHTPSAGVAEASSVGGAEQGRATARPRERGGGATKGIVLAVAPAQVVSVGAGGEIPPAPPPSGPPPPAAQPVSLPAEQPTPPTPAASSPGAPPSGPISAGVTPAPGCEGDEYTVTIDTVTIEVGDEGDLANAESSAILLVSEGDCVAIQNPPPEGDDVAIQNPPPEGDDVARSGDDPVVDGADGSPAGTSPVESPSP